MFCMGYIIIVVGNLALECSYNYVLNYSVDCPKKQINLGLILEFTFIHLITECTRISTTRAVY